VVRLPRVRCGLPFSMEVRKRVFYFRQYCSFLSFIERKRSGKPGESRGLLNDIRAMYGVSKDQSAWAKPMNLNPMPLKKGGGYGGQATESASVKVSP
jgi:hypothetical protein